MPLTRREDEGVVVIELTDRLDHAAMAAVKNTIAEVMLESKFRVVLDMSKVSSASLMPVGLLVEEMQKLRRRGGDLKLVGVNEDLCVIFEEFGIADKFCRYESLEHAILDFGVLEDTK